MDKKRWIERWQANNIGFHQEMINIYLQSWWPHLNVKQGERVFVPLCGKSKDLLWLLEQGYQVIGVEVSSLAVKDFFLENSLTPEVTKRRHFEYYQYEDLSIYCGDFFSLNRQYLSDISAVFDRASLVALTPELRSQYSQHLIDILPAKTKILLLTIEYDQEEMEGPPFAVMEDEVQKLFSNNFKIELLEENDMLEDNPRFKDRGLSRMIEKVYCLT